MGIGDNIKHYAKNKAKKWLRRIIIKILFPWGLIVIIVLMILGVAINSIQLPLQSGSFSDQLNSEQNTKLDQYVKTKVDAANKNNTFYKNSKLGYLADFYEFDRDMQLKTGQVKSYLKYLELSETEYLDKEEDIYDSNAYITYDGSKMSKLSRYERLVDKAVEELKPRFDYEKYEITTKRKYQVREYEYKEVGAGLYDNNKNLINSNSLKIVKELPGISQVDIGQKYYISGEGTYEVDYENESVYLKTEKRFMNSPVIIDDKIVIVPDDYYGIERDYLDYPYIYTFNDKWLYKRNPFFTFFQPYIYEFTDAPKIDNLYIINSNFPRDLSEYKVGDRIYSIPNKSIKVVSKKEGKKYFNKVSSSKPSNISNITILNTSKNLPAAKEMKEGSLIYCIDENLSFTVTSKLTPKEDPPEKQSIYVLTKGENIENTWECTYEYKTNTTTTTEEGIEGEVTYEVTRPIIKERKKIDSDYGKLKNIITSKNPNEDFETILSLVKFSDDTSMSWFFMDPKDVANTTPIAVPDSSVPVQYQSIFNEVAQKTGVPAWLLMGIAKQESNFDPEVEYRGAYGMMQFQKNDTDGDDLWRYHMSNGLDKELKTFGYNYTDYNEAWSLYLSSAKMQVITGSYVIRHYINYTLWKTNIVSKYAPNSVENMALIDWNSDDVSDFKDIIRRALACYNMGESKGLTTDLNTNKYANSVFGYSMKYRGSGNLIEFAKKFLGTPYVWGGTTPDGFDCSGFVQYVYKHNGYSIPRTTSEQIGVGQDVSIENLAPGNLIFFDTSSSSTPTKVSHVGMYIGDGLFIHAPSTGDVVKVTKLAGYYTRRFLKAKKYF